MPLKNHLKLRPKVSKKFATECTDVGLPECSVETEAQFFVVIVNSLYFKLVLFMVT